MCRTASRSEPAMGAGRATVVAAGSVATSAVAAAYSSAIPSSTGTMPITA